MASSDHLRYRPLLTHAMDVLRDCTVQAERLYVRLAAGAHSTRIGVVLRPRDMTGECRMRPSEIDKAILELADVGLLRVSVSGAVYLVGHCESACPKAADNRRSWRDEALRILTGNRMDLLPYVLDSIGSGSTTGPGTGGATGEPVGGPKKRERETKQKETSTPSESVADAPADTAKRQKPEKPHHKLIDLWNSSTTRLPKCLATPKQVERSRAAMNLDADLDAWKARFAALDWSDHHAGKGQPQRYGDAPFMADFKWAVENIDKCDKVAAKHRLTLPQQPAADEFDWSGPEEPVSVFQRHT